MTASKYLHNFGRSFDVSKGEMSFKNPKQA